MLVNKIPDQYQLLQEFYNSPQMQDLMVGKDVIATGNSMGGSHAEALAAQYNVKAITTNSYGV